MKPQFLIGAAMSGSGKTTFTMGLLRALKRRGLNVQPYKCGPDYIDTQYHTIASENVTVNLDTFMASRSHVQHIYNVYGEKADACVIEGAMGLFDGYNRKQGSSSEIASLLNLPVILVVNAKSTAYSVAALLYGFKHFDPSLKIAGVIFNQVSSPSHYAYLRDACVDARVRCLGYLFHTDGVKVPSRHLGLTLNAKKEMDEVIERIALLLEETVDLEAILELTTTAFPCAYTLPYSSEQEHRAPMPPWKKKLTIAIARDSAFSFVYRENLDRMNEVAHLVYFSPLHSKDLPKADIVYLPGGYPELFARQLHRRRRLMEQIRDFAESGGKILAECGGMMYLTRSITARKGGTAYAMCGVLPLDATMEDARLHLGYRRMTLGDVEWRGHEFHYSDIVNPQSLPSIACQSTAKGLSVKTPLYRYKNVVAGYTHWYWGENNFLDFWKEDK